MPTTTSCRSRPQAILHVVPEECREALPSQGDTLHIVSTTPTPTTSCGWSPPCPKGVNDPPPIYVQVLGNLSHFLPTLQIYAPSTLDIHCAAPSTAQSEVCMSVMPKVCLGWGGLGGWGRCKLCIHIGYTRGSANVHPKCSRRGVQHPPPPTIPRGYPK